jgi:hypothetical protein
VIPLLLTLLAAEIGPPTVIVTGAAGEATAEARVTTIQAAREGGALLLRLTFDRSVHDASTAPDGSPMSGRLRVVLYLDTDDDRRSGFDAGPDDLRTGADQRLELGVLSLGADEEEKRPARALITVTLAALARDGRRHTLWRADDEALPAQLTIQDEWIEIRIPPEHSPVSRHPRLILTAGERSWDGRVSER